MRVSQKDGISERRIKKKCAWVRCTTLEEEEEIVDGCGTSGERKKWGHLWDGGLRGGKPKTPRMGGVEKKSCAREGDY